jgi:hypothetical protein
MNYIKPFLYLWGLSSWLFVVRDNNQHFGKEFGNIDTATGSIQVNSSTKNIDVKLLDEHYRIYPDRFPDSITLNQPINVPRNYTVCFQLALRSTVNEDCRVSLAEIKDDKGRSRGFNLIVHQLLPVHVEGNTQGSLINHPGGEPPSSWKPFLIRMAPFDVLEAITDANANHLKLTGGQTSGALLQMHIAPDCPPGLYKGIIKIEPYHREMPFLLRVHKTVLPSTFYLQSVHWLSALPENLKAGPPCEWWSEQHWNLLKRAGRLLIMNGDNVMFTPLINTRHPLIQTTIDTEGKISFQYKNFDRWVATFQSIGFKYFAGQHLSFLENDFLLKDKTSGRLVTLSKANTKLDWFTFLELFLNNFYIHLEKIGIKNKYLQHIYDEPADINKYKQYEQIARRAMPGIKLIDAVNSRPASFSPMVDIQVFNFTGINQQLDKVVKQRRDAGKDVWLYNCSSPYPPYPNCHLDLPLTECRLWPWLCYKYGATGYLWWAANLYRGIKDEYKTSLGPAPDGTPIHPPGDDWFYYRSIKGLIPSMRIISFREGMTDVTLLSMLQQSDSTKVKKIMAQLIYPSITEGHNRSFKEYLTTADIIPKGYETNPVIYDEARKEILNVLDKEQR